MFKCLTKGVFSRRDTEGREESRTGMGEKPSKDGVSGSLGTLMCTLHCRFCPKATGDLNLQQSTIGHGYREGTKLQDTSRKGCPVAQEQPSKESCRDEPLAAETTAADGWMHQTDKRHPRKSEQCTSRICYRGEALFLRAMCQNPRHYLIQTSQLHCMIDIILTILTNKCESLNV